MAGRDLDDLLGRVDLEQLADQLIGVHRGRGAGARWASPVPDHPQTGESPPMSIFTDRRGRQRFTCWATGTSGTAIDLVAVTQRIPVADAIGWLGTRHGSDPVVPLAQQRRPPPPARTEPSTALLDYISDCEHLLHTEAGAEGLRWLVEERCINPDVIAANRLGYDPGPAALTRGRGLPHLGTGIVIPTFNAEGQLSYAQTRYLDPAVAARRKYDNPSRYHGQKPRLSYPQGASHGPALVVCEGVIDALTVKGARHDAVALVAAGDAAEVAKTLQAMNRPLVIAIDCDHAGNSASETIIEHLDERTDISRVTLPGDVNDLARRSGSRFASVFAATIRGGRPTAKRSAGYCHSR